jgi:hypothetical protein
MKRISARVRMVLALALGVPLAVAGTAGATAAPGGPSATHVQAAARGHGLPWRLYAPYFETWTRNKLPTVAQASGARYLTWG